MQSSLRYRDIGSLGSCRSTKDIHRSSAAFGKKSRKSSPLVSVKSVHIPSAPRFRSRQLEKSSITRKHFITVAGRRKSPASLGSNWKRDELSAISRPLPHSLWKHAQVRSETGLATCLCFQVRTTSSGEGRQLTPVEGASGAAVARRQECFLWQGWRLVEPFFRIRTPFDLLAPQTMPQDAEQSVTECGPAEAAQITKWHQRYITVGSAPAEEEESTADHPRALFHRTTVIWGVRAAAKQCVRANSAHLNREKVPSKTSQSQSFPPRTVTRREEIFQEVDNGECSRGEKNGNWKRR